MTNVMDSTVGKWCLVSPTSDCAVWAIGPGINQLELFSYLCFHDGKLFSGYSTQSQRKRRDASESAH